MLIMNRIVDPAEESMLRVDEKRVNEIGGYDPVRSVLILLTFKVIHERRRMQDL